MSPTPRRPCGDEEESGSAEPEPEAGGRADAPKGADHANGANNLRSGHRSDSDQATLAGSSEASLLPANRVLTERVRRLRFKQEA